LNSTREAASAEAMCANLKNKVAGNEDFSQSLRNSPGRLISRKAGKSLVSKSELLDEQGVRLRNGYRALKKSSFTAKNIFKLTTGADD
jgi:hypothetical protein